MKKLLILPILALLAGCAGDVQNVVQSEAVPVVNAPAVGKLSLQRPTIKVVNATNAKAYCSTIGPDDTYYVMDYNSYSILIDDFNSFNTYVSKKNAEVDYYKNYLNTLGTKKGH